MATRITEEDLNFGKRLKYARMNAGLSQNDLAELVNLTFQQIQKYEKGLNRISASRLFQFAKILKVSIDFFFRRDDIFSSDSALAESIQKRFDYKENHEDIKKIKKIKKYNDEESDNDDNSENDLLQIFKKVKDKAKRKKIVELIKSFSEI